MAELDARSKHLRRLIVRGLAGGASGHIGSSMSLVEILRVLYDDVLCYRPDDPKWPDRDRLILSKGHGCLALYSILADRLRLPNISGRASGFFPVEWLDSFARKGSLLGGHPDTRCPGIEWDTGALGHGLPVAVGMALELRHQKRPSRVFVVMGDGECQEGSVWEAAMHAATHKLSNLTVIVDYNGIQSAGKSVPFLAPLAKKWREFGFVAAECDGHNVDALRLDFRRGDYAVPLALICHTIKGKGLPFAENDPLWHHRPQIGPELIAQMSEALV